MGEGSISPEDFFVGGNGLLQESVSTVQLGQQKVRLQGSALVGDGLQLESSSTSSRAYKKLLFCVFVT